MNPSLKHRSLNFVTSELFLGSRERFWLPSVVLFIAYIFYHYGTVLAILLMVFRTN